MKEQREDGRQTLRPTVPAHDTHAEVDIILGWQMDSRTRNLRAVEEHILVGLNRVISQICTVPEPVFTGPE